MVTEEVMLAVERADGFWICVLMTDGESEGRFRSVDSPTSPKVTLGSLATEPVNQTGQPVTMTADTIFSVRKLV